MIRYKDKGYTIEIPLQGTKFSAECTYSYDKSMEKYKLCMWLKYEDIDDKFKIESQGIDTQYISGTKETIRQNICKIVEQMYQSKFFDYFMERYNYYLKCFAKGNEYYETAGEI